MRLLILLEQRENWKQKRLAEIFAEKNVERGSRFYAAKIIIKEKYEYTRRKKKRKKEGKKKNETEIWKGF